MRRVVLPNRLQQTGWQELDFAGLSFSSRHKYQDMQVQSSREIEVPLMQLNSWKVQGSTIELCLKENVTLYRQKTKRKESLSI